MIAALTDHGVTLYSFSPHSGTTMRHYDRVLLPSFREHVALALVPITVRFAAGDKAVVVDVHRVQGGRAGHP